MVSQALVWREGRCWRGGGTRIVEEAGFRPGVRQRQIHGGTRAGRLAAQRDAGGVAAELGNMGLDPFERKSLVQEANIQLAVALDVRRGQVAKCAQPVLDLDSDEAVAISIHQHARVVHGAKVRVAAAICARVVSCQFLVV